MSLLAVNDIHTYYGRSYVLQGVSLEIQPGEIVALLGRNGAGKTTTLSSIVGLAKPKGGRIFFQNREVTKLPAYEIARLGLGYVPQGRRLFPKMSVLENLKTGFRDKTAPARLKEVLELFPILGDRLSQRSGTLSGGEQQMLAIARALLTGPSLLILDEPTTGLMPLVVKMLLEVIRRINQSGVAVLLVEEQVPFALALADRIYFMVKGRIAESGSKDDLRGQKEVFMRYLGVEEGKSA